MGVGCCWLGWMSDCCQMDGCGLLLVGRRRGRGAIRKEKEVVVCLAHLSGALAVPHLAWVPRRAPLNFTGWKLCKQK